MKKKPLFLAAMAVVALASCTSDEFVGDPDSQTSAETPISFGFDVPSATRASGSAAASNLGNKFIVYGEKAESSKEKYSDGNLVFPNYTVAYTANTAFTTTSNTKDWEYVGTPPISTTNVKMYDGSAYTTAPPAQDIKYWDYGAGSYTFTAVSADATEIAGGKVVITKNTTGADNVYQKGYTIALAADATPANLYLADRKVITASAGEDRTATDAYGGHVELTFRSVLSQIRVGMYEDVPGYDVVLEQFYTQDAASPTFGTMTTPVTANFACNVPNIKTGQANTLTVTYENPSNRALVSSSASAANVLTLGTNLAASTELGESASDATFDYSDKRFTYVFPQEGNDKNLKLKLKYKLTNTVTGEVIHVDGATAEVPVEYLKWKPNYKYTYLFKVSNNTNGSTGQGVVGLFPITFDAVQIESTEGNMEFITTVTEPSITTYAKASDVLTDGEYKSGAVIYNVVEDGSTLATLTKGTNVNLYTITGADATYFTAAAVAESIIERPTLNAAQATTADDKLTLTNQNSGLTIGDVVKDAGNNDVTMGTNKVASFTGSAPSTATYYVLEYIKEAATYTYDAGQTYTEEAFNAAGILYTRTGSGPYTYTKADSWVNGTTYYKATKVATKGTYTYKIIKVVPAP